jgi:hypothetical protein
MLGCTFGNSAELGEKLVGIVDSVELGRLVLTGSTRLEI